MFEHDRTGALLLWLFIITVALATTVGVWLEHTRARHQREAETAEGLAKAAEQADWDAFWNSVPNEGRDLKFLAAEWKRLYSQGVTAVSVVEL